MFCRDSQVLAAMAIGWPAAAGNMIARNRQVLPADAQAFSMMNFYCNISPHLHCIILVYSWKRPSLYALGDKLY